jgi:hypothetical protein
MKRWLIPASTAGKIALLAILVFIIIFVLSQTVRFIPSEPPNNPSFFSSPVHAVLLILAWATGSFAFFSGLFAVIKQRERAIPVFVAALLGLFVFLFGVGEVLFPH